MSSQRLRLVVSGLFILWLFFVLASFFAVQKPFTAANVLAIGRLWLDLLAAGWLGLIAVVLGAWLLSYLLPTGSSVLESLILGGGLGLGSLGLLNFGLGLAGLFRPVVAYGAAISLTLVLLPQLMRLYRRWRQWRPANPPNVLTGLYLGVVAVLTLPVALLPPTDWDGLFYHLTGPKLYLQAGHIAGGIDIPHLSFPSLMEMLFTWAILLRSDIAAKLLHTGFALLLAGLVYLIARRFFGRKPAWLAVLVFASMPMVSTLAGWAYNDLALAFYQLASLYAIINYQLSMSDEQLPEEIRPTVSTPQISNLQSPISSPKTHHSKLTTQNSVLAWLFLSAIFAGLAMGLKYTSFVTPLVIAGLIGWSGLSHSNSRKDTRGDTSHSSISTPHVSRFTLHALRPSLPALRTAASHLAIFALIAALVAAPWYLKSWFFTGNPVYPFLYNLFGGQFWDSFRADWYAAGGTGIGLRPSTWLALPWLLTLGIRDANYWDGRTGPLFLLFLPLIVLYMLRRWYRGEARRVQAVNALLIFALAQFVVWVLGVSWSRALWQSRLLLPALIALAPVVGWLWADLPRFDLPRFSVSRFANLAIGVTLALTLVDMALLTQKINPLPYLTGLESSTDYLTRRLGAHYVAMQQINDSLPANAVVTFLWEPRSYYCRLDCRPDSILDAFPHLVYRYGSAARIAQAWREAGVTHVLVHTAGLNFVLNEAPETVDTAILADLEANELALLFEVGGAYQLYTVEPAP